MRLTVSDIIKKLISTSVSLFVIISLTFFLMKIIPGDPFEEEQALPKEIHDALRRHYGLDQSWPLQYKHYLGQLFTGDLGPSFKYKDRTVNQIIKEGFPVSALLGLEALALAISGGIFLGGLAALKENKWQDHAVLLVTTMGVSVPSFILAALLQYGLALQLNLFPLARWGSFSQTVLPSMALAALPLAFIARLTRSSMIDVLKSDYIKTAKAKGLSSRKILFSHVLPNSLLPVLTYLGQLSANMLAGSFIVEKIFSVPGLGQWFVNSVSNRDYTVIMGLTIFYSAILMSLIFLVDMAYTLLDPRIKLRSDDA